MSDQADELAPPEAAYWRQDDGLLVRGVGVAAPPDAASATQDEYEAAARDAGEARQAALRDAAQRAHDSTVAALVEAGIPEAAALLLAPPAPQEET